MAVKVIDPGPIPLASIERYDDPDIEGQMEHHDIDPAEATFRLVEIALDDLEDVKWLPGPKPWGTHFVEALSSGARLPPIVIVPTSRIDGKFGLLDGLCRTHAHWALGRTEVRAYELLAQRRPW